jgi:hypothetical protein
MRWWTNYVRAPETERLRRMRLWRVGEDGRFEWLHPHPQRRVGQNASADGNN